MRLDNLLTKRWSRNATLVQGLVALDIIEELGFGLDRMVAAMAEAGLPAPVFADTGDTFVVTLYGAAAQLRYSLTRAPGGTSGTRRAAAARRRGRSARHGHWSICGGGADQPARLCRGAGGLRRHGGERLRALVEQGLVRAEGTTKDRRYVLRTE